MNSMEKGNNNKSSSRDEYCYGDDLEMTLMTTTSTSPQGAGGGGITNSMFSSTSSSSCNNLYQQYGLRIGMGTTPTPPSQLDSMDRSPSVAAPSEDQIVVEREHMFDKVVTPSDVGKLNRLVIPKQHAEKYFPLDSSTNDKGLLLNFEDVINGKLWRFRYSYWNSSQSYVMTKGWSRFVKEKKLDPGDIVSFLRAKSKLDRLFIDCKHHHPPPHPQLLHSPNINFSLHPCDFPGNSSFHHHGTTMGWSTSGSGPPLGIFLPAHVATPLRGGGEHYYHPSAASHNPNWRTTGYNNNYLGGGTNNNYNYSHDNPSGSPLIYYRSSAPPTGIFTHHHHHQQQESSSSGMMRFPSSSGSGGEMGSQGIEYRSLEQVLLHSVPVVQGKVAAKRLRLFGVNMDCPISKDDDDDVEGEEHDITILPSTTIGHHHNINTGATLLMPPPSPNSLPHLVQLRLNNNDSNNGASSPHLLSPHHHHLQFH